MREMGVKKKLSMAGAGLVASVALTAGIVGVATPASADDDSSAGPKPCQPGARYAVGWDNSTEKLFNRDCKSDDWGVKTKAVIYLPDGDRTCTAWDHSSAGNGNWKDCSALPGPYKVTLKVYGTRPQQGGTIEEHWKDIKRDYYTAR